MGTAGSPAGLRARYRAGVFEETLLSCCVAPSRRVFSSGVAAVQSIYSQQKLVELE